MALSVNIKKQVGDFKLNVSFENDKGILALLGASGCGKSMTLKCIAGIETPDQGQIILNGRTLFDSDRRINLSPQERKVGYLFQDYALFPNMTVAENIMAGVRQGTRREKRAIARERIRAFGMEGTSHLKPIQLSGGQKQRVALARILVNEPDVLLLDEPFSALDSSLKWQLEMELADTLKDFDHEVIFVSHNQAEVYRLCQSVCILTQGHSEPKTSVPDLFDNPQTVSAARIIGCKNISEAIKTKDHQLFATGWGIHLNTKRPIPFEAGFVGIMAQAIGLVESGTKDSLRCEVLRVIEDVSSVILMVKFQGEESIRLEITKEVWSKLSNKSWIHVMIDPAAVMILNQS